MLDTDRADELRSQEYAAGYVRPDYGGYCFAGIPGTAASVLGADLDAPTLPGDVFAGVSTEGVRNVVVLFVDALGFEQLTRVRDRSRLLRRFADRGRVTPLTSVYPSETAACVATFHTASYPVEHGLLGWYGYDPGADAVYETLPYAAMDGGDLSLAPDDLTDADPVYPDLADAGVAPHTVQPSGVADSETGTFPAATGHAYDTTAEFAVRVRDVLRDADRPTYCYAYYPSVDTIAHHHGTRGDEHDMQVAEVCDALDRAFDTLDDDTAAETLVLLVADHGQVTVDPDAAVDLADTGALDHVPTDRDGTPLVLGGPRNVLLRTDDPAAVRESLQGVDALVLDRDDALDAGLWGPGDPGPAFARNCGDLVVVPADVSVWHGDSDELALPGMHGGLTTAEALVPFAAARADDLR